MKETEFYGPEGAEQKMEDIILLGEIEVQIKAYLWDRSKGVKGTLNLDIDELKTIIRSAITTQVESTEAQIEIAKCMEEFILYYALEIPQGPYFRLQETAEMVLDWVSTIKEKVFQC